MDFNKKYIEDIIEAVENHTDDVRYSKERAKVRRALPSLKEALLEPEIDPQMMEKAYEVMMVMMTAKVEFDDAVKYNGHPTKDKFFEAITGLSREQSKDDLDFCNKYVTENKKIHPDSRRRYREGWQNFGSMRGRYWLHQLREEWEGDESQ